MVNNFLCCKFGFNWLDGVRKYALGATETMDCDERCAELDDVICLILDNFRTSELG